MIEEDIMSEPVNQKWLIETYKKRKSILKIF